MSATGEVARRHLYGRECELGVEGALFNYVGVNSENTVAVERYLPEVARVGTFLDTGARLYKDIGDHLEVAEPECQTLAELVAQDIRHQEMLADLARAINQGDSPPAKPIRLNTRVVDHHGNTWGSHQNYSVPYHIDPADSAVSNILASQLVTSSIFTGVGEVVAVDERRRSYDYTVTQKLRRVGTITELQTTKESLKPIVNTRNEPHGRNRRMHIICGDPTMTPWATTMAFGTTQLVLDLLDIDRRAFESLTLKNPIEASRIVANDLELDGTVELVSGKRVRPYELQQTYAEMALQQGEAGVLTAEQLVVAQEWYAACDAAAVDPSQLVDRVEWLAKMHIADRHLDDEELTAKEACGEILKTDRNWGDLSDEFGIARELMGRGWFRDPLGAQSLVETGTAEAPEGRARLRSLAVQAIARNRHKAHSLRANANADWTFVSVPGNKVELRDEFGMDKQEQEHLAAFVVSLDEL